MRFPDDSTPTATLLKLGRYAGARVLADPEVSKLAVLVRGPQTKLKAALTARNEADDAITDVEAARDVEFDGMSDLVGELGLHAHAQFKSREADGYQRMFHVAPSALVATPIRDRTRVLDDFVKSIASAKTPAALRPLSKQIADSWKRVQASQAAVDTSSKSTAEAIEVVQEARTAWITGYRRLFAQLTDRYPTDKKRVERYFRTLSAPAGKKGDKDKDKTTETPPAGDSPKA